MRLLLLGPPGSGKGTQADRLVEILGVRHISSGDLLRAEVEAGTPCGRAVSSAMESGELVPDDVVIEMLRQPILDASAAGGYLLDGFPRTLAQAESAAAMAREEGVLADAAVFLAAEPDLLVRRLLARAEELGRADDNETTIRHRIEVYNEKTEPLRKYYAERGILLEVDGLQTVDQVTADILDGLGRGPAHA
ncbi:MAG: adenylate kinase [Frankiaceae bacterium]|nr:adenylate kinase [Frankiaceae bacterium]MDQ1674364.1 adenylate kinase [Frankiaceae bacterium]